MGKYFSDEQIEEFLKYYLQKHPDALQRMEYVMLHPFENNDELISRNMREMNEIADVFQFYKSYSKTQPSAIHHLARDVATRVSTGLSHSGNSGNSDI